MCSKSVRQQKHGQRGNTEKSLSKLVEPIIVPWYDDTSFLVRQKQFFLKFVLKLEKYRSGVSENVYLCSLD